MNAAVRLADVIRVAIEKGQQRGTKKRHRRDV